MLTDSPVRGEQGDIRRDRVCGDQAVKGIARPAKVDGGLDQFDAGGVSHLQPDAPAQGR